jgi:hypothetical protein
MFKTKQKQKGRKLILIRSIFFIELSNETDNRVRSRYSGGVFIDALIFRKVLTCCNTPALGKMLAIAIFAVRVIRVKTSRN